MVTEGPQNEATEADLPKARVRRAGWNLPVIWIVPLAAAMVAAYLVYEHVHESGQRITIEFKDVRGLRAGQTGIYFRGVQVGQVTAIELSKDLRHALVKARLDHSADPIARTGSVFWIVRPEVGLGNITGLGTFLSGPEIEVSPGAGVPKTEFAGLDQTPLTMESKGLSIVLRATHLGYLKRDAPVYYRGIEVGAVQDVRLSADATAADVHVLIEQRYRSLVRDGSEFWRVGGAEVRAGLLRGLDVKVESLGSLVAGGVVFATPDNAGSRPVKEGTVFALFDEPQKAWLDWAPRIRIGPEE